MHASFSFHQSNQQLAYTTQAWNFNLKLVLCKQTYEMLIQMHQLSLWVCFPYLCAQILIDPLTSIFLPLCYLFTIFVHYFSPFVINDHKGSILDRLRLSMSINGVRIVFPNSVQSRYLPKTFNSVWSKGKLFHTSLQGLSWPCWVKHL